MDYVILGLYFLVLFVIGTLASRRVRNISDYFAGGKSLGYWVVSFSAQATGSSAWLLLGLTGMGALLGVQAYWVALGTTAGVAIAWFRMAKPFKQLTDRYDALTVPDFLAAHFPERGTAIRLLSATVLSVFVIIYVSAQIDATGTAFESFYGWNYYAGAVFGFLAVVVYLYAGGFIAVAWSDVFQGAMMLAGLVLLPIAAFIALPAERGLSDSLHQLDPNLLNIWGKEGFGLFAVCKALGFMMIGLGYLGSPQLFVRYISARDEAVLDKGKWVAVVMQFLMNGSAVSIGILGRVLLTEVGEEPAAVLGNGGQSVLIRLVEEVLPTFLTGLYMASVLAAIMSTIDSLLIVAASAVVRDGLQQTFKPHLSGETLSALSRWVTLGLSLLALGIALVVAVSSPTRTVFWFVIFGWSGIAASFCPVILLSLFWKKYTANGALVSMFVGFAAVPIFKFWAPQWPVAGPYFVLLAELLPSFVVSVVAGVVVSYIWPRSLRQHQP